MLRTCRNSCSHQPFNRLVPAVVPVCTARKQARRHGRLSAAAAHSMRHERCGVLTAHSWISLVRVARRPVQSRAGRPPQRTRRQCECDGIDAAQCDCGWGRSRTRMAGAAHRQLVEQFRKACKPSVTLHAHNAILLVRAAAARSKSLRDGRPRVHVAHVVSPRTHGRAHVPARDQGMVGV